MTVGLNHKDGGTGSTSSHKGSGWAALSCGGGAREMVGRFGCLRPFLLGEIMTIPVTNIQRFSVHDGPGIRTTVFMKGCPLRCKWCHNPETKRTRNEIFFTDHLCMRCGACVAACPAGNHTITPDLKHLYNRELCKACGACAEACPTTALEVCAKDMTVEEILEEVLRDKPFYGENGGITLSGGEPMLQGEKSIDLLKAAKAAGLNTAIETCGYFDPKFVPQLVKLVDLFLYDVKDTDPARHKENTGVDNRRILANLREIDRLGGKTVMRCVAVKDVNFTQSHIEGLAGVFLSLKNCLGVEFMPYHAMGGSKSERLGRDNDGHTEWVPDKEELENARNYLRSRNVKVIV